MSVKRLIQTDGPFRAEQLRAGDPYELSDGHPVECLPSGGRHSRANLSGGLALQTDPAVESAGFDTGFTPDDKNLRAPDLAIGKVPDTPGWVPGAPPLAVEYADTGQDEGDLQDKIRTLLAAGTRFVWVVRLSGLRRVEVHAPGAPHYLAYPGQYLEAPGVLSRPVPVEALYDPAAAHETALGNLLARRGYASLEAVREEGRGQGESALVLRLLERAVGALPESVSAKVRQLDRDALTRLAESSGRFETIAELLAWMGEAD